PLTEHMRLHAENKKDDADDLLKGLKIVTSGPSVKDRTSTPKEPKEKEDKLERLSYNSARNFMANLGFNKRYFEDLHVLMMKKVFEPDQPKWRFENNVWLHNEYHKSEYSAIYQFYQKLTP
ncbi:hypothetical protein JT095_00005, partial [Helicobacter pylori]|nr:hypothetical protein [Helicobacter pylori]